MGTIKVKGQGELKFTPDVTRITVEVEDILNTYEEAFNSGTKNSNSIKQIMAGCSLDTELAKTSRFNVSKHTVHKKIDKNEWQWVTEGYKIQQTFIIDLALGCKQLTTLLDQIGKEIAGAEIEFGFTISDTKKAHLKVIETAVKDAQEKAEVMAKALGKKLGNVLNINYGIPHENYHDERVYECCPPEADSIGNAANIDITPDDLRGYSTVEVSWELV